MADVHVKVTKVVRSPDFRDIYVNSVRTAYTPWDFLFMLSILEANTIEDGPAMIDQAGVRMSPQHFKAFIRALNECLRGYEDTYGFIPDPKEPEV